MKHRPTVLTAMTPFPHWMDAERSCAEARAMMKELDVHHLPTKRDGVLVGLVHLRTLAGEAPDTPIHRVHDSRPAIVAADSALDAVLLDMAETRRDAVVVTRHGALAGILTHTDIYRFLVHVIRDRFGVSPTDDDVA